MKRHVYKMASGIIYNGATIECTACGRRVDSSTYAVEKHQSVESCPGRKPRNTSRSEPVSGLHPDEEKEMSDWEDYKALQW